MNVHSVANPRVYPIRIADNAGETIKNHEDGYEQHIVPAPSPKGSWRIFRRTNL